jgi:site-specific DNA recombinase
MTHFHGKRVAIYARYSSMLQSEASIDDQVRRCSDFVVRAGGAVDAQLIFTDAATSGASLERVAFERMMGLLQARPRRIDVIVTEDLSRISRDFADAAHVFKQLRFFDVPLIGVADGIDTSRRTAKIEFTVKSLMTDMQLDDIRDKTRRGLLGRAINKKPTGGLAYGYRSSVERNESDHVVDRSITIDPERAAVVERIFRDYLEGRSQAAIARALNAEGVPSPRAKTRYPKKGWVDTTIRAILRNPVYIGQWKYGEREWVKVPGTNIRRPRMRDAADVHRDERPELRIIEQSLWDAVQARISSVAQKYGGPNGAPSKPTTYPLSGLLECACCGALMVITTGSSAAYYRCVDNKKRGTCDNARSVREDVARRRIFDALMDRLNRPEAIEYLRKRIAEQLGELGRNMGRDVSERRERLARTEQRIHNLLLGMADGERSEYARTMLKDLEAQAAADKAAILALEDQARVPVVLPTPDQVARQCLNLERMLAADPLRAREALRRFFQGGRIRLTPGEDGVYYAEGTLLPLIALSEATRPPGGSPRGHFPRGTSLSCAGWI